MSDWNLTVEMALLLLLKGWKGLVYDKCSNLEHLSFMALWESPG